MIENLNNLDPKHLYLDYAIDAIIVIDDLGLVEFFNKSAEDMFGYKSSEILGQKMSDFVIPSFLRSQHSSSFKRHLETGHHNILNKRVEVQALRRSGETFYVELTVVPIHENSKKKFIGYIRDISVQKEIFKSMQLSLSKYKNLINSSNMMYVILDRYNVVVDVNSLFLELFQCSIPIIKGFDFETFIGANDLNKYKLFLSDVHSSDRPVSIEISLDVKGVFKWVSISASIFDDQFFMLVKDITKERIRQYDELVSKENKKKKFKKSISDLKGLMTSDIEETDESFD